MLSATVPLAAGFSLDDVYEDNDTPDVVHLQPAGQAGSSNFGPIDCAVILENLAMGTDGHDYYRFQLASAGEAVLSGDTFSNRVVGFERVHAYAGAGEDVAKSYDSAGNDQYVGLPGQSLLFGDGFPNPTVWFERVHCYASAGGQDVARLYDSPGNDTFVATPNEAVLRGSGLANRAKFFERVEAISSNPGDQKLVGRGVDFLITYGPW